MTKMKPIFLLLQHKAVHFLKYETVTPQPPHLGTKWSVSTGVHHNSMDSSDKWGVAAVFQIPRISPDIWVDQSKLESDGRNFAPLDRSDFCNSYNKPSQDSSITFFLCQSEKAASILKINDDANIESLACFLWRGWVLLRSASKSMCMELESYILWIDVGKWT